MFLGGLFFSFFGLVEVVVVEKEEDCVVDVVGDDNVEEKDKMLLEVVEDRLFWSCCLNRRSDLLRCCRLMLTIDRVIGVSDSFVC